MLKNKSHESQLLMAEVKKESTTKLCRHWRVRALTKLRVACVGV